MTRAYWLAGVDLWFTAKSTELCVELRIVENGMPTGNVLDVKRVAAANTLTNGNYTLFQFDCTVYLEANREYCFVVMCNEAIAKAQIAKMGEYSKFHQRWVASQLYTVGIMLPSANASITGASREIDLGAVEVMDAIDLLLNALYEIPTSACPVSFSLTLPDGKSMVVLEGQPINLGKKVSGKIGVKATLSGDNAASPILYLGTQLVCGSLVETGNYYTSLVVVSGATKATLMYEAIIPSGSGVGRKSRLTAASGRSWRWAM